MKIGVIGYGSIGKRHHANLSSLGCTTMVYDTNGPQDRPIDEMIEWSDALLIASPTSTHFDYLKYMARVKKPIFMEKPIAATRQEGHALNAATWSPNFHKLMVGYNLRFLRTVQKTNEVVSEGRIKPVWARFTCAQYNDRREYRNDGVILNWSHEIDLALHLLGPAKVKCSSTELTAKCDVMTDIILEHNSGVISTIHLDYLTEPQVRGFMIIGEDSKIICDIDQGAFVHERSLSKDMLIEGDFDDCYVREMEQFIKFCETGDLGPACSATEALQVLDICLNVRQQAGLEV